MPTSIIAAIVGSFVGEWVAAEFALADLLGGFLTASVVRGAVGLVSSTVIGSALRGTRDDKGSTTVADSGTPVSVRQAAAPWQIVYGERRCGGIYTFIHVSADNQYLHLILTLAGHECNAIGDVYFDDEVVPLDGSGNATGKYAGFVRIKKSLGGEGASQPFPDLATECSDKWTANHLQRGHTKLYVRLLHNRDLFARGTPNITCIVQGKTLWDPRSSTTVFSRNPALAVADYLTNTTFGFGAVYAEEIDEASLIAAANICDEDVNLAGGGTEDRYRANGVVTTDVQPKEVLGRLLDAMAGKAANIGGRWFIHAGAYDTPTVTLDESDLSGRIATQPLTNRRVNANGAKGVFVDPGNNWQVVDFPALAGAAFLAEDNGERAWKDLDYRAFVTSSTQAQRLSKIVLYFLRQGLSCTMQCKLTAWRAMTARTVLVNNTKFGWSAKPFEVEASGFRFNADGTLGVELSLRETAAALYDWSTSDEQAQAAAPNTNLPDPYNILPPTSLVLDDAPLILEDGSVIPRIKATWTASSTPFQTGFEVRWKSGAGAWTTQYVSDALAYLQPLSVGSDYDIEVYTLTSIGRSQTALTASNHTAAGQDTAPPTTNTFQGSGGAWQNILTWDVTTSRADIWRTEIWASLTNDRNTATKVSDKAWPAKTFVHLGLSGSQTWYYWSRVVDTSGNYSTWNPSSATAGLAVTTKDSAALSGGQSPNDYGGIFWGNATKAPIRLMPLPIAPSSGDEGAIYYDSGWHSLLFWDGNSWVFISGGSRAAFPPILVLDSLIPGVAAPVMGNVHVDPSTATPPDLSLDSLIPGVSVTATSP